MESALFGPRFPGCGILRKGTNEQKPILLLKSVRAPKQRQPIRPTGGGRERRDGEMYSGFGETQAYPCFLLPVGNLAKVGRSLAQPVRHLSISNKAEGESCQR